MQFFMLLQLCIYIAKLHLPSLNFWEAHFFTLKKKRFEATLLYFPRKHQWPNARWKRAGKIRRNAKRVNPVWSRAISRSVMKILGCIDMHLQDSDCARRASGVHFMRFQDFPPESRKSEFFTIARITAPSSRDCIPRARWNPFRRYNIPMYVLKPPILFFY